MHCVNIIKKRNQLAPLASLLEEIGAKDIDSTYKNLLEKQKYDSVLNVFLDHQSLLWEGNVEHNDISTFYVVLATLLFDIGRENVLEDVLSNIVSHLQSSTTADVQLRLKILTDIYNIFCSVLPVRPWLYTITIEYAFKSGQMSLLTSELKNFETVSNLWNMSTADKRNLYNIAYRVVLEGASQKKIFQYASLCLSSYEKSDFAEKKDEIKEYVLRVLNLENITLLGKITQLDSVKSLAETYPDLSTLLTALYDFQSFEKFVQEKDNFLTSENLNKETLKVKSRLCTLVNFCARRETVSYSEISDLIHIDLQDVERWVIKASSKQLMECQLDQLEECISVRRAIPVNYEKTNWEYLLERTQSWKKNLELLSKSLNE